jgi:hypothetical protein
LIEGRCAGAPGKAQHLLLLHSIRLPGNATVTAVLSLERRLQEGRMEQDLTTQIQILAYQIWELEGRPIGRERIHWLRAEAQIRERFQAHSDMAKKPVYRVVASPPKKALPPPQVAAAMRQVAPRYARPAKSY